MDEDELRNLVEELDAAENEHFNKEGHLTMRLHRAAAGLVTPSSRRTR
jgi:hypothetical protein